MNQTKNSTYYSRILNNSLVWYFQIPINYLQLENESVLNRLQNKILNFNLDYIRISAKYDLAQILGKEFLKLTKTDLAAAYIDFQKSEFEIRRVTAILPSIEPISYGNTDYKNLQASKLFYHDENNNIIGEEIYDLFGFKNLSRFLEVKTNVDTPVIEIDSPPYAQNIDHSKFLKFNRNTINNFKNTTYPLQFGLSLKTNLFQDRFYSIESYKREVWMKPTEFNGIDNSTIALQNSPRFNSFLRELTELWIKKYNWKVIAPVIQGLASKHYSSKGVKVNNSLIYLEDL